MTRFKQEWALVPTAARWAAALATLAFALLMTSVFLLPLAAQREWTALLIAFPFFLASMVGGAALGVFVLLVGYVYADAGRRGMNQLMWTLLAVFIPSAIGIILYFILRDPVLVPCPRCATPARKGHAYCAGCGAAVRPACPACRLPVEAGWRNCAHCGAALPAGGAPAAGSRT
jgi:hypothetical protein